MSDTSEESVKTRPRNKKGFREPTSLHVDPKLWQEVRVMAVLKGVSVTEYFEDALRKKIDADNLEVGKQGYRVGQGGMYIPPPPGISQQPQQQNYSNIFDADTIKPYGKDGVEMMVWMPDLQFPTNKDKLIQHAEKMRQTNQGSYQINLMKKLPNKKYNNVAELERELRTIYTTDKDYVENMKRNNLKIVSCEVYIKSDPKEQKQKSK